MAVHYRTQGFFIKKVDRTEADQLFTIYTKDFGRLEILGKAIRKIKSKLRSGADIFYLSDIEFIQGKTQKTLTDAILIEKFENLRRNLKKLKIAYKIAEVFDELVRGQEKDEDLWNLLKETIQKLNNLQFTIYNLQLVYFYFLWNLLSILGYQPELYNCVLCQKKLIPGILYFSSKEGGIICQNCSKENREAKKIDLDTIKILRLFLEKNWPILNKLKIKEIHLKLLKNISQNYLNLALGKIK